MGLMLKPVLKLKMLSRLFCSIVFFFFFFFIDAYPLFFFFFKSKRKEGKKKKRFRVCPECNIFAVCNEQNSFKDFKGGI